MDFSKVFLSKPKSTIFATVVCHYFRSQNLQLLIETYKIGFLLKLTYSTVTCNYIKINSLMLKKYLAINMYILWFSKYKPWPLGTYEQSSRIFFALNFSNDNMHFLKLEGSSFHLIYVNLCGTWVEGYP